MIRKAVLESRNANAAQDDGEFQRRKRHVIQVILDLHSNSTENSFFERARNLTPHFSSFRPTESWNRKAH
jgi:hypothetical protein